MCLTIVLVSIFSVKHFFNQFLDEVLGEVFEERGRGFFSRPRDTDYSGADGQNKGKVKFLFDLF